ncbi:MAG: hypothetical protein PF795_12340 [Kiritimatiellae bacterium]|jgi:uncharacterized protein (DUF2225 family)|nr:hypothetical protein [Kiritimatiellia bacterium]
MFLTCKQVSNHLSKEDYDKLSPFRKYTLKFHVWICPICGKYNRQVMKFQDMARIFRKKEEELLESNDPKNPHLDEAARRRLEENVKRSQTGSPQQDQ